MKENDSYVLFVPYLAYTHILIHKILFYFNKHCNNFLKFVLLMHFDYIEVFFTNKKLFLLLY